MEQRVCKLSHEIEKREQMCDLRLAEYQARQEALEAQEEELAREQREAERLSQDGALNNSGSDTTGNIVRDRYGSLPDGPARLSGDARTAGESIARLSGVRMTGQNGAYALSSAMTDIGAQLMGRMTQQALGNLESSLQEFSSSNPRPTEAQLESFRQEQAALAGQYAEHMTRVERADPNLPLGDESAVVGSYVDHVLELVQMRNSGELDEPIAALGAGFTTILALRSYQEIKRRAESDPASAMFEPVSEAELREARQSVSATVKEARARLAAERQRRLGAELERQRQAEVRKQGAKRDARRSPPAASSAGQRAADFDAASCISEVEIAGYYVEDLRNKCPYRIACDVFLDDVNGGARNFRTRVRVYGNSTGANPHGQVDDYRIISCHRD